MVAGAEPVQMTEAQYRLYFDYLGALNDPRVAKLPEAKRLPAIAHNFKVTPGGAACRGGEGATVWPGAREHRQGAARRPSAKG